MNFQYAGLVSEELDLAEKHYRASIAADPTYASAYTNLGTLMQNRGKMQDAVELYNHALRLKPDCAATYTNLGVTLQDLGQTTEAIAANAAAIKLNPKMAPSYNNLARAHEAQQAEQRVRGERALVRLVDGHDAVARQQRVRQHLAQQAAVGEELEARVGATAVLKAHRVAHRAAQRSVALEGDAARHGHGRHAPRLRHRDGAVVASQPRGQQYLRYLCRLPRARFALDEQRGRAAAAAARAARAAPHAQRERHHQPLHARGPRQPKAVAQVAAHDARARARGGLALAAGLVAGVASAIFGDSLQGSGW
jgi:Tfp pilus assembly protein PilF